MNIVGKVSRYADQAAAVDRDLRACVREVAKRDQEATTAKEALEVVIAVGDKLMADTQVEITELSTLALQAVFSEDYSLGVCFESKRNQSEVTFLVTKGDLEVDPMSASGGGVVDVLAFCLRVVLHRLTHPALIPVLVLDEPFRHLSTNLQRRAGAMVQRVSEELGVQFIVVSHEEALVETADRVWRVRQRRGRSEVQDATD